MRLHPLLRTAALAGIVASLTACSFITSLFPDKQKQYRYSNELPDLEIPPDLTDEKIDGRGDTSGRAQRRPPPKLEREVAEAPAKSAAEPPKQASAKKRKPTKHAPSVTLAESSDNAALIEMEKPYAETWNDVSRALGRLKIEITDQNRSDGVFYVYYGGEPPKKPEDTSVWDTVVGVFSIEKDKAVEYRVKLEDKDDYTFIRVLDQGSNTVSEGQGLELLKRLHKKLLTLDQPEAEDKEPKEEPDSEKPEKAEKK